MTIQTISYKRGLLHIDSNALSSFIVAKNENGESKQFKTVRAAKEWLNRYQGHKNWNYWNVSLWLNNDAWLYEESSRCVRGSSSRKVAAEYLLMTLHGLGMTHTPDGAPYSVSSIRAAMVGM